MLHQEFEPPIQFKDVIKCFWYDRRDLSEEQSGFEVLPDSYAEIIFHFGNLSLIINEEKLQPMPSPFLIGLLNNPARFSASGRFQVIGICCYPWTVFELLGLSSDKNGVQLFSHPIASLQSQLKKCINENSIEDAINLIKHYFLDAELSLPANNLLFKAGTAMTNANGTMPVSEVAQAANSTIRTLERKFRQSSGHTVKDISGLMRFEQVRNQLLLDPDSNIAGMAHDFGYADQSHLSKEFKRYSGTTPSAFAKKAKKG